MKPELSIIIVNFNTKDLVLDCIASIEKESVGVNYEIIVIDNGSKDRSAEVFKSLNNQKLRIIENKVNLGFAKANNKGIRNAKSKYILLLNSDTLVKKNAINRMLGFARKTKDTGVVGARLLNIDGTIQPSVSHFPTVIGAIREYWLREKGSYELYTPYGERPSEVESVVGASFLITPEALKRVGLLDERYFMYFEDLDYCRRVRNMGLKVYYLPGAEVIHYHGASGKNIVKPAFQWRRLIPSSKIYNGIVRHCLLTLVIWTGQKWQKIFKE